jgi:hypothetical protein
MFESIHTPPNYGEVRHAKVEQTTDLFLRKARILNIVTEESIARQRLATSAFRNNEYACRTESVATRLTHVS